MSSGSIIGIIRVNVEPMIGTALVSVVNYHLQGQCWLYCGGGLWWMQVDADPSPSIFTDDLDLAGSN